METTIYNPYARIGEFWEVFISIVIDELTNTNARKFYRVQLNRAGRAIANGFRWFYYQLYFWVLVTFEDYQALSILCISASHQIRLQVFILRNVFSVDSRVINDATERTIIDDF
jgi:hypothetical protein